MKFSRLTPSFGATATTADHVPDGYDFGVSISESATTVSNALPSISGASVLQKRVPHNRTAALPWSVSTIVGWAALGLGTIVTIVIVVVAVTLP